ncbi:MAG: hypothetical protein PF495_12090 [Spirochaetales bacterium]|nr:hypothetical protein [Spirochaetales bacterium]
MTIFFQENPASGNTPASENGWIIRVKKNGSAHVNYIIDDI